MPSSDDFPCPLNASPGSAVVLTECLRFDEARAAVERSRTLYRDAAPADPERGRLSALLTENGAFPRYTELRAILAALGIPRGRFFVEFYGLEAEELFGSFEVSLRRSETSGKPDSNGTF